MYDILQRDITGHCIGECRDRVLEGEQERQAAIEQTGFKGPEAFPRVAWACSRTEQPGVYGGHV